MVRKGIHQVSMYQRDKMGWNMSWGKRGKGHGKVLVKVMGDWPGKILFQSVIIILGCKETGKAKREREGCRDLQTADHVGEMS